MSIPECTTAVVCHLSCCVPVSGKLDSRQGLLGWLLSKKFMHAGLGGISLRVELIHFKSSMGRKVGYVCM